MALTLAEAAGQLTDRSSAKRRSAAKRLRALADPKAGPALLSALESEIADPRTWETQYQIIMALGACHHAPALDSLQHLAEQQDDYTMVGVALGDALVRIEWATAHALTTVDRYMQSGPPGVVDGAFRALAIMELVPDDDLVDRILAFAERLERTDPLRYWVAASAAGWSGPNGESYLRSCLTSPNADLRAVAAASLAGTRLKHRPL
jgi:HEAT repeat protein